VRHALRQKLETRRFHQFGVAVATKADDVLLPLRTRSSSETEAAQGHWFLKVKLDIRRPNPQRSASAEDPRPESSAHGPVEYGTLPRHSRRRSPLPSTPFFQKKTCPLISAGTPSQKQHLPKQRHHHPHATIIQVPHATARSPFNTQRSPHQGAARRARRTTACLRHEISESAKGADGVSVGCTGDMFPPQDRHPGRPAAAATRSTRRVPPGELKDDLPEP